VKKTTTPADGPREAATALKIRELFAADVTRDIPPVVYFHEQSPEKIASEVGEYIITGGYPDGDPRARRAKDGIHEQLVRLFRAIARELDRPGGPELPASWISGYYGSGKSIFAKLVGLSLDGAKLPDGTPLATALLRRDDSPRAAELAEAWEALRRKIDPIAVVFDIGAVARDGEPVHSAVLRKLQARLGYCPRSNLVAEHELKLEQDGQWDAFIVAARKTLGRPWSEAMQDAQADDHFSHVLHVLDRDLYEQPLSWIDSRAGATHGGGTSVEEVVRSIAAMLDRRAAGKQLFIVVDEVSQYVHQDDHRMLKLQSFVSDLGQKLRGRVWLLATGQQKLEDGADAAGVGKLKDRFPPALRVHLAPTNIRDVVHKRLLRKAPAREAALRVLFDAHRADLKLHGYGCEEITADDFVDVYPLLPGHVDLFMKITSSLRTHSLRVQGDDHAIRGLLQLMGEVFREQQLGLEEVGALITLDRIYDVEQTALDPDIQTTMLRLFEHADVRGDPLAIRVAKAVALLELVQEEKDLSTHPPLVAKVLYSRLGEGDNGPAVTAALERLRALNLLGYSEKYGFNIQSSAGQEWARERENHAVGLEQVSELVREALNELLGTPERPRLKGRPFALAALYTDRYATDQAIHQSREDAAFTVDFRFVGSVEERAPAHWVKKSDDAPLRDRLVWVVGETASIAALAREVARSRHMVGRYGTRRETLLRDKQRLLIDEIGRAEDLAKRLSEAVGAAFVDGSLYFRGRRHAPRDFAQGFAPALTAAATSFLPELYPFFIDIAVTESELKQLLEPVLSGPSTKFMEKGLGILALDSGKYIAKCDGEVPERILKSVTEQNGAAGATLLAHFGGPPYGYAGDVVRACIAGLLRAGKVRIRPESGVEHTSVRDPGTQDLFLKDRPLRRSDILPARVDAITQRDRVAVCRLFQDYLKIDIDRENEAIADAVYQHFPAKRRALEDIAARFERLPSRPPLPPALVRLGKALEDCKRDRHLEQIVQAAKRNLDALRDGFEQLGTFATDLTDEAIAAVRRADEVREHHLAQLRHADGAAEVEGSAARLEEHLGAERPWRGIGDLAGDVEAIRTRHRDERRRRLEEQGARCEAAKSRLRRRAGFAKLSADEVDRVFRPITEAMTDTTPDATYPTLVALRDEFAGRLVKAEAEAEERLDEILSRGNEQVVKLDARIAGREVASPEELKALLREIEERVSALLKPGVRVRIL